MLRLKLFVVLLLAAVAVPGVALTVAGQTEQEKVQAKESKSAKPTELPKEIKIPEVRTDKVLLFQEQGRNVQLEQQAAIARFRATEEWKALEARQKLILDKLEAELRSALSLAGIKEEDFPKYKYDQKELKLTYNPNWEEDLKKAQQPQ